MTPLRAALATALTCSLAGCGSSSSPPAGGPDGGGVDARSGQDALAPDVVSESAVDAGGMDAIPPTGPLCTVASRGTAGVVLSGRLLLTTGAITGELFVGADGTIACAAASCASTAGYASATRLACPGGAISPALVNAHDHSDYATTAPQNHGMTRYQCRGDWRVGEEGEAALPDVKSTTSTPIVAAQELRLVLGGGLSVIGTGGVDGLARNLAEYKETSQLGGLTGDSVYFDTFPLGDTNGVLITSGCAYPDILSTGAAFSSGLYAPHIAEGINLAAQNELHCLTSSAHDLVTKQTSIIHGVAVNATDVATIAKAGAKLIWSPRSNVSLYGDTAPLTEYKNAGITIALGTDWLPSGSMNELRELACADAFNQKYFAGAFSDQDLWAMATTNAAYAAGFGSQIGSLAAGHVADVVVFDGRVNTDYRAVIAAAGDDVHLVLRSGKALYGDADLVDALATGCGALEVCGVARSVCFDVPGTTLTDTVSAGTAIYPLFSCRGQTPPGEPTCVPYRDTYPDGTSATDGDGDGVPDDKDDCPTVWNPIRPMDGSKQADVDGDGVGDACDAQPTNASAH